MTRPAPPDVLIEDILAEMKARASIAVIADELDLEYRRIVPGVELRRFARDNGADLRGDETKSFVACIMAEAVDAEGNTTYLAVEAACTGDLHDVERARSCAALMQRFANTPCRAVIASARTHDRRREDPLLPAAGGIDDGMALRPPRPVASRTRSWSTSGMSWRRGWRRSVVRARRP